MPRARHRSSPAIALVGTLLLATAALTGGGARAIAAEPVTVVAGNGIYSIAMRNAGYPAAGTIVAGTGPTNPYGPGIGLLYGGATGATGTSYVTVRVYDSSAQGYRDFTQGERVIDFSTVEFDDTPATVEQIGTNGLRITHDSGGFYPQVKLTETVSVEGTTFEDSVVVIELTVTNSSEAVTNKFGIRHLLDLGIGADDGTTFQLGADPTFTSTATEYPSPPLATAWTYADNDTNGAPLPSFHVAGTSFSRPQLMQYACEQEATRFPFAYEIHAPVEVASPSDQCSTTNGGDSALLTTWGADKDHAAELGPGESFTVTQTLMIKQVRPIVTALFADPVLLKLNPLKPSSLTTLHARLVTAANVPVVGRQVAFSTPGKIVCVAVTNTNGDATCTGFANVLAAILNLGITASFAGDATYAPALSKAPLIG